MSLGAAAGGAVVGLQEILKARALKQIQAQNLQQQQVENEFRAQQLGMQQDAAGRADEQFSANQARQKEQDEIAATGRRQVQNDRGEMMMIGDAIADRGLTPEVRRFALSRMTSMGKAPATELFKPTPEELAAEDTRKIDVAGRTAGAQAAARTANERPPQGPQPEYDWVTRGDEVVQIRRGTAQRGDVPYDAVAARQHGPDSGVSDYAVQTAERTIAAIDEVLPKINAATSGIGGAVLRNIPGTPAANVSAQLASVASNISFNALQAMRDASKTGGALGAISERELDLLSSVEGSLRQDQSSENLKAQLSKVRASMARVQLAASVKPASSHGGGRPTGHSADGPVYYDANGHPVKR